MSLSHAFMLRHCRARDSTYDGCFLLGVLTTRVYCLPSCPARDPKKENLRFFPDETSAKKAGLRACKRCRPNDFYRGYDPNTADAEAIAERVRAAPEQVTDGRSLRRIAGVESTNLTALFRDHFHTTPAVFLSRTRVEEAAQRLLNSDSRVLDIGRAVGFDSGSALHDNFRCWTGLAPKAYRALRASDVYALDLPKDYRPQDTLGYLGRDAAGALEKRDGDRVEKAFVVQGCTVLTELTFRDGKALVALAWDRRPALHHRAAAHRAVVRMLGLNCHPRPFERRTARVLGLGRLINGRRGSRIPLTADPFEALVWSVVGQQVNLAFAQTLRTRLAERIGRRFRGRLVHPTPADVAGLDAKALRADQFSERKAQYLIDLAAAIESKALDLERLGMGSALRAEACLLQQRGIGPWSANYILMRGFGLADCIPLGDTGLTSGLQQLFELEQRPGVDETRVLMAPFAPYRSLATLHIWKFFEATR